ncbi:BON domain-containing protein [Agriterribacter sp.]|uniref:BON domain-containing protein n=1 Tax=Agriterribacter sp. TaxID=2821509 RepID=UPI002B755437|nr:BON domain-containing protein [Agriterribacter sp.]HRP54429.1 BON domain-containing protein [Agriterribacter sp.]
MKKTLYRLLRVSMVVAMASIWLFSCKPKISGQDIEAKIQSNSALSHLAVTVKDGVVTLSGEAKDEADRANSEAAVKSIEGVKEVVNNTTIAPAPAPVEIAADDPLTKGIADALKDFPTVKATANDGVITVTGETTAANWKKIKMALDGLKSKKVDATALKIN